MQTRFFKSAIGFGAETLLNGFGLVAPSNRGGVGTFRKV
jgi:hypothetical protein